MYEYVFWSFFSSVDTERVPNLGILHNLLNSMWQGRQWSPACVVFLQWMFCTQHEILRSKCAWWLQQLVEQYLHSGISYHARQDGFTLPDFVEIFNSALLTTQSNHQLKCLLWMSFRALSHLSATFGAVRRASRMARDVSYIYTLAAATGLSVKEYQRLLEMFNKIDQEKVGWVLHHYLFRQPDRSTCGGQKHSLNPLSSCKY